MGSAEANLEALTTRVEERHGQHGEVAFRLEPELKEGRGGLRDVHSLAWAEATEPVLHASEAAGLSHAFEVLLTVRVELHRVTGGRSDRLLLELQDEVAERLSHGDADRLMADVAAAAAAITWVGDGAYRRIRRALRDRRWRWSTGRSRPEVVELGDGIGVFVEHRTKERLYAVPEDDGVGHLHHGRLHVKREQNALLLGVGHLFLQKGNESFLAHEGGVEDFPGQEENGLL